MSTRPAVTGTGAVGPLSNRLHAVLAVGMRLNPSVSTGVVYSDEPPDDDIDFYFGNDDEYDEPYAKDDPRWSSDFEWVLERIRENRYYFYLASKEFRKRRELAMTLVSINGTFLEQLSPLFKNDREIVTAALTDFPEGYGWISDELKRDDEIIRLAFSGEWGHLIYHYLPDDLKQNRDYMRLAVEGHNDMFNALPESAKNDRLFVMELLKLNPHIAAHLKETYADQEFWIEAVKTSVQTVREIPMSIPRTRKFLLKLVRNNGGVLDQLIEYQTSWFNIIGKVDRRTDWRMDIEQLSNDPEFRLAAATAVRNPNMNMMGAILKDLDFAINVLVKETLIVETDSARKARMKRLEAYQLVLENLARVEVAAGGPMYAKIQELTMLLNNPTRSEDLFNYRMERDLGDIIMLEESPGAKRARVATETRALAAGLAMSRQPVKID